MEIVPLLHIRDGEPVVGRPGQWEPAPKPYPDGGDDLFGLVRHLHVRFGSVYLVDFGTGRSSEPHLNLYQKLVKQNVRVWVDAFPQTLEDVMDLFISGADRVTVRLDRFDTADLDEVLLMADGEVWLGLPFRTLDELDRLITQTDPEGHLQAGAQGSVLIDLASAGTGRGADVDLVQRAPPGGPVVVSGGARSPDDADRLEEAGAAGILVGRGIFDDLDGWAKRAQGQRPKDGPRTVGSTSASVRVDQPPGLLPGVLPSPPPRPRPEDEEQR